jgi:hypothetical protein
MEFTSSPFLLWIGGIVLCRSGFVLKHTLTLSFITVYVVLFDHHLFPRHRVFFRPRDLFTIIRSMNLKGSMHLSLSYCRFLLDDDGRFCLFDLWFFLAFLRDLLIPCLYFLLLFLLGLVNFVFFILLLINRAPPFTSMWSRSRWLFPFPYEGDLLFFFFILLRNIQEGFG